MKGRAGSKYSVEQWKRAEKLVLEDRATLEEAAELTGINANTLRKRAGAEEWVQMRERLIRYRPNVMRLKAKALSKALEDPNPERIQAWATIERTFPEKVYGDERLEREEAIRVFERFTAFLEAERTPVEFREPLRRYTAAFFAQLEA